MRRLGFGYLYQFRQPPGTERPWPEFYAAMLDVIAETERLGFAGAFMSEHHLAEDGHLASAMLMLTAIAGRTRAMRLSAGVMLGPLYDPLRLAEDSTLLANLSGGRFELGIGLGYRRREYEALGIDFARRGRRLAALVPLLRRLWAGETVSAAEAGFRLEGAWLRPLPPEGRVPVWLGAFSPPALARAAVLADGFIGPVDACRSFVAAVRAAGRDPAEVPVRVYEPTLVVTHDKAAALDEVAAGFHHVNESYAQWAAEEAALGTAGMTPMPLADYKASGAVRVMAPGEAIDLVRALQAELPLDQFILPMPTGLPPERLLHYAQVFAREVIPAF